MALICPVCGKEFEANRKRRVVCSRQCAGQLANAKKPEEPVTFRPCKVCGSQTKYEFCSSPCKKAYVTGAYRRPLYEYEQGLSTAQRIQLWHSEGMTPEAIANVLARDINVVREVLGIELETV